jgi:hypothetical protein
MKIDEILELVAEYGRDRYDEGSLEGTRSGRNSAESAEKEFAAIRSKLEALSAEKARGSGDRAWLLERGSAAGPEYAMVDHGSLSWTKPGDHASALRLSRRADAEALAAIMEDATRVAEHMWHGADPTAPNSREAENVQALRDELSDAYGIIDMMRVALGVEPEPHQSIHERTMEAIEADRRDAERYRYLRRRFGIVGSDFVALNLPKPTYIAPDPAAELDAAIDTARSAGDGEGES